MPMRNVECGVRNGARVLHALRIPHFAFATFVAACSPTTTRPDYRPLPLARTAQIYARPQQVIPALADLVKAESLRVRRANPRDGYLETDWYDTRTHRSFRNDAAVRDMSHTVKLRCWADPYVPGQTILTVEVAYRLRQDPSRNGRDLEILAAGGQPGDTLAGKLLAQLKQQLGAP